MQRVSTNLRKDSDDTYRLSRGCIFEPLVVGIIHLSTGVHGFSCFTVEIHVVDIG